MSETAAFVRAPARALASVRERVEEGVAFAQTLYGWRHFFARTAAYGVVAQASRPFTGEAFPQTVMRYYLDGVVRQLGITLLAHGTERIRAAAPCVIVVNHNSLLDIPCVGVVLDFDYKWVAKKEIFRLPFIGWHLQAGGHLYVDRKRRDNAIRLEREFHRVIGRGASLVLFPEGTRSKDGRLQAFRRGPFVTAVREQVPVLPIALNGTEKLLEKGSLAFPSGKHRVVGLRVGELIPPPPVEQGSFDERVKSMSERARAAMIRALDELRGEPGAAERPTI